MPCGARTVAQVALLVVLLAAAADAGASVYYAFHNAECEGDYVEILHSQFAVVDGGYKSYIQQGEEECTDVSRWEVMVVTGVRIATRLSWGSWSRSRS